MKVKVDPDSIDVHAKKIIELYPNLEIPLEKIRNAKNVQKAKENLKRLMHDAIILSYFKNHGPLNIEIEKNTLYILNKKNKRLNEKKEKIQKIKEWKKEEDIWKKD